MSDWADEPSAMAHRGWRAGHRLLAWRVPASPGRGWRSETASVEARRGGGPTIGACGSTVARRRRAERRALRHTTGCPAARKPARLFGHPPDGGEPGRASKGVRKNVIRALRVPGAVRAQRGARVLVGGHPSHDAPGLRATSKVTVVAAGQLPGHSAVHPCPCLGVRVAHRVRLPRPWCACGNNPATDAELGAPTLHGHHVCRRDVGSRVWLAQGVRFIRIAPGRVAAARVTATRSPTACAGTRQASPGPPARPRLPP